MREKEAKRLQIENKRQFVTILAILTAIGIVLRWSGIWYEGIDYTECLSAWYAQLKAVGSLSALKQFEGNYNLPYVTAMWILTWIPVEPIISIKMLSIVFDFLSAGALATVVMHSCREAENPEIQNAVYGYGALAYGLILVSPITFLNSGYLAQSDGIYAAMAFLAFSCLLQDKPVRGFIAYGCAVGMKLQALFAAPILGILYWCRRRFSILHVLWVPVTIELLCIPAILAGCGWDISIRVYLQQATEYPYMYYFYPNIWTFFRELPYYAFGKIAMAMALTVLLAFCVLIVISGREHKSQHYIEYFTITAMTCAMFLPCMHERYNYLAETLALALAVVKPCTRIPALVLVLTATQCYAQTFFGWYQIPAECLAVCNIGVYLYLLLSCARELWGEKGGCKAC